VGILFLEHFSSAIANKRGKTLNVSPLFLHSGDGSAAASIHHRNCF